MDEISHTKASKPSPETTDVMQLRTKALAADAAEEAPTLADYVYRVALHYVTSRLFRMRVMRLLVRTHIFIARDGDLSHMRAEISKAEPNTLYSEFDERGEEGLSFVPNSQLQLRSLLSLSSCLSILGNSRMLSKILIDLLADGVCTSLFFFSSLHSLCHYFTLPLFSLSPTSLSHSPSPPCP